MKHLTEVQIVGHSLQNLHNTKKNKQTKLVSCANLKNKKKEEKFKSAICDSFLVLSNAHCFKEQSF